MRIYSINVLCAVWLLSSDSILSKWMHWWYEDFKPNSQLEDDYVFEYGNEIVDNFENEEKYHYQKWDAVRNLYENRNIGILLILCMRAHGKAGRGNVSINAVKLNPRILLFENPFYEPRYVDVLTYGVRNETNVTTDWWDLVVGPQNYITEGIRPDCVCYLTLLSSLHMQFSPYEQVCGINVTGITNLEKSARRNKPGEASTTTKRTVVEPSKKTKSITAATEKSANNRKKSTSRTTKKLTTEKKSTKAKKSTEESKQKTRRKIVSDTWS